MRSTSLLDRTIRQDAALRAAAGGTQSRGEGGRQDSFQYHGYASQGEVVDPRHASYFSSPSAPPDLSSPTMQPSAETQEKDIATSVRSEWQQYGAAKTQVFEDLRRGRYVDHRRGSDGTWLVVQVVRAESRTDMAGAMYTTYIIHVFGAASHESPMRVVERRYSDFGKLFQVLKGDSSVPKQQGTLAPTLFPGSALSHTEWYERILTLFPQKHWAGRIGNWIPSQYIAPEQYTNLIEQRIHLLDAWLVYVVYAYNVNHQDPHPTAWLTSAQYAAIQDFITLPSPPPPFLKSAEPLNISTASVQWNNPLTFTLGSAIRQATLTVQTMTRQQQRNGRHNMSTIPMDLLHMATGIVFLTVVKVGMVVSGRVGTGLFLAKRKSSGSSESTPNAGVWSAPVAVGTVGLGWGALLGGDLTHSMIVLTTEEAVADFGRNHTVHLGTELGIAVGVGMTAAQQVQSTSQSVFQLHSSYAYAISSGLFVGISLEGSVLSIRPDVNAKFYGQPNLSVTELLQSPGVPAAEPLYHALQEALSQEIPQNALFKINRLIP